MLRLITHTICPVRGPPRPRAACPPPHASLANARRTAERGKSRHPAYYPEYDVTDDSNLFATLLHVRGASRFHQLRLTL